MPFMPEDNNGGMGIELKPYPNEHACRVNEPGKYKRFARKNNYITVDDKKVDVIFGITADGKTEIQAYRYSKGTWTSAQARAHCRDKGSFSAATGEEAGLMPSLEEKDIQLCKAGAAYIEELVRAGKIDKTGIAVLTEVDRKSMLGEKGDDYGLYAKHFLGEDVSKPEATRMRFTIAVVRDGRVQMKPLMKACSHDDADIRDTARRLCKMAGLTEGKDITRPTRERFGCPVMATGQPVPMNVAGKCRQLSETKGCNLKQGGAGACNMMDADGIRCPMMKAGEGNPMDGWQGCAEHGKDGMCGLQAGVVKCNMVKDDDSEGGMERMGS